MLFHGSAPGASPSARTRVVLLASIAALVVTTFEAQAAPVVRAPVPTGVAQVAAVDGSTDLGARKRVRRGRGNAAGLAMMGMMIGTIGGVIAAQQRRKAYERAYAGSYGYYPYGYSQGYDYAPGYAYRRQRSRVYDQPQVYRQPRSHGYNSNPVWHDRLQRIDPQNPNSANPTGVPRIGW